MRREETIRETSTASLLIALVAATSSKRFHVSSLFSCAAFSFVSSCSNLSKHSLKSSWSASNNSFLTFRVRLWTAWFQWLLLFLSNDGKIIGSTTFRFWMIKFLMWSLFHRNKARSATWTKGQFNIILNLPGILPAYNKNAHSPKFSTGCKLHLYRGFKMQNWLQQP